MEVWFVGSSLRLDQDWEPEIREAVNRADVIIALISWRSFKPESYMYPDPNFVFEIVESNLRDDLLLLPLLLGRFAMPAELVAIGVDYSRKSLRRHVVNQLLDDLKRHAIENNIAVDGCELISKSEPGYQWSSTRWKELSGVFVEIFVPEKKDDETVVPSKPIPTWRVKAARSAKVITYSLLGLVTALIIAGVGLVVNFVNSGGSRDSAGAPVVIKALTVIPLFTPRAKLAIPSPTITAVPGLQYSSIDGAPLIYIPTGSFTMGSNDEEREQPVHLVILSGFWIDKFEVTNIRYATCVNAGVCSPPSQTDHFADPDYANHPIVFVDWNDAKNYCEWAGRRLPTEAEWEKAARGTDKRFYPWGNDYNKWCERVNYKECVGGTTPVGSYPTGASPYGVLDMAGNAWEWVSDWYSESFYSADDLMTNPFGPFVGEHRVLRGGSWSSGRNYLRTTDRWRNIPTYASDFIGFRCVLSK